MPEIPVAQHPWIWSLAFGFLVAAAVLLVSTAEHGIRASNLLLALVVFVGFGLLGVIGALVRRYTPGGPV
jgi:hypothetical protein